MDPPGLLWKQKPGAQRRRIKYWIKNSFSRNTDMFGESQNNVADQQEDGSIVSGELHQRKISDSNQEDCEAESEVAVCQNIDEAMTALRTSGGSKLSSRHCFNQQQHPEYDWILDGEPERVNEYEKSNDLRHSLCQLELEDPIQQEIDGLERQEMNFANFDDDFFVTKQTEETDSESRNNKVTSVEGNDEFCDSVAAESVAFENDALQGDDARALLEQIDCYKQESDGKCSTVPEESAPIVRNLLDCSDDGTPSTFDGTIGSEMAIPRIVHCQSIYNSLPLADVSSPEGRFTRKRQLEGEQCSDLDEEIENALPSKYYDESFDGTAELLQAVPWQHVLFWQSGPMWAESQDEEDGQADILLVDDVLTQQLSQLDTSSASVTIGLLRQIQRRESMMDKANELLHDMDHNLAMAHMYAHRGSDVIARARGKENEVTGILGIGTVLQDSNKRDYFRHCQLILKRCATILKTEESLKSRIALFGSCAMIQNSSFPRKEYHEVIRIAAQLRTDVTTDKDLLRLVCLDEFRKRACTMMDSFQDRLHALLGTFVGRCCLNMENFSNLEYETLASALLDVHAHNFQETRKGNSIEEGKDPGTEDCQDLSQDVAEQWAQTILNSLSYEAEKCLARALLDPTTIDEEARESNFEKELIYLSYELNTCTNDTAKLRNLTHNLLTIRFDFEADRNFLPYVYHKSCESLTDVLHAHYVLTQWHGKLFYEHSKGIILLHDTQSCNGVSVSEADEGKFPNKFDKHYTIPKTATASMNDGRFEKHSVLNTEEHAIKRTWQLGEILRKVEETRIPLWKHCESVLVNCLDEYLNLSAKKNLFDSSKDSACEEDCAWIEDLEGLHDILVLTNQFLSLGCEFLASDQVTKAEITSLNNTGQQSDLHKKLQEGCDKHLRSVHVAAMNALGGMLFNETWQLFPVGMHHEDEGKSQASNENEEKDSNSDITSIPGDRFIKQCLFKAIEPFIPASSSRPRCWENEFYNNVGSEVHHLENFIHVGNPFIIRHLTECEREHICSGFYNKMISICNSLELNEQSKDVNEGAALFSTINSFLRSAATPIASQSALKGLTQWSCRLLLIITRLPLVHDDITVVFSNMFDLYFTTVFRLCVGSAKHENILLGIEPPAPKNNPTEAIDPKQERNSTSPGKGLFGRKINQSRRRSSSTPLSLSPHTAADVCSPLPCETIEVTSLRNFIARAQKSLEDIVNLEKTEQWISDPVISPTAGFDEDTMNVVTNTLEKREGAAWSCIFVAVVLNFVGTYVKESSSCFSRDPLFGRKESVTETKNTAPLKELASLIAYENSVVCITPTLATLASRMSCTRAIFAENIVQEIISVGRDWEESKLFEHSNSYIDELEDRCVTIWRLLCNSPRRLPSAIVEKTWGNIVYGGCLALLEGFSKIAHCSTEGRALMSMDLDSFCTGIAPESVMEQLDEYRRIENPPLISPQRGMQYVDAYIKVFYYPKEDVMNWIAENHKTYHFRHSLALITSGAFDSSAHGNNDSFQRIRIVKGHYESNSLISALNT